MHHAPCVASGIISATLRCVYRHTADKDALPIGERLAKELSEIPLR
jgi:hypothetical protein